MQRRTRKSKFGFLPSIRNFSLLILDAVDRLTNPGRLVPPRSLMFRPSPFFAKGGEKYKKILIEYGDLQPDQQILEIGSGEGRAAIPLRAYLSEDGGYWGLDIRKESIDWCTEQITAKYPNFHFQHWDIINEHYNPNGVINPEAFSFPFDEVYFDLVFLMSVFTHMGPGAVRNYLGEISRVLKPGGKCLFTIFLLTEAFKDFANPGIRYGDFKYHDDDYRITEREHFPSTTAFRERFILDLLEQESFELLHRKGPGTWITRNPFMTAQELIVVRRI